MVNDDETNDCICWTSEISFAVVDRFKLADTVLPTYFKSNNFASFVRQLNKYGFYKQGKGWEFKQQQNLFVRGDPQKMCKIERKNQSSKKARCSGKRRKIDNNFCHFAAVDKREEEMRQLSQRVESQAEMITSFQRNINGLLEEQETLKSQITNVMNFINAHPHVAQVWQNWELGQKQQIEDDPDLMSSSDSENDSFSISDIGGDSFVSEPGTEFKPFEIQADPVDSLFMNSTLLSGVELRFS